MSIDYKYKISICISSYNQKDYLEECIQHVFEQNIAYPYEIIVCDDGSNDGSYEMLMEKYGDVNKCRLAVARSGQNQGMNAEDLEGTQKRRADVSTLENVTILRQDRDPSVREYANWRHARVIIRMLRAVQGEYFILLDGDDYLCGEGTVNEKIRVLDDPDNQECVICMGNMKRVFDDGSEEIQVKEALPQKRSLEETFFHYKGNWRPDPYLHIAAGVARSSVIKTLREEYCQDLADVAVYFWIMNYGQRYYVDEVGFAYRIHQGTIWSGEKAALSAMRNLLGDDARNLCWNGAYKKQLMMEHYYDLRELRKFKGRLNQVIDVELWQQCIDRYPGLVQLVMRCWGGTTAKNDGVNAQNIGAPTKNVSAITQNAKAKFGEKMSLEWLLVKGFWFWIRVAIGRRLG